MTREIATTQPSALELSFDALLVVVFVRSQSTSYAQAVNYARGAARYVENGEGRAIMHAAAFGPSREQAARALALLDLVQGWRSTQVWCAGRQLVNGFYVRRTLDCYVSAGSCSDPRAHCIVNHRGFTSGGEWQAFLPCRQIAGIYHPDPRHPSTPGQRMQAVAVERGCDWCPRFKSNLGQLGIY